MLILIMSHNNHNIFELWKTIKNYKAISDHMYYWLVNILTAIRVDPGLVRNWDSRLMSAVWAWADLKIRVRFACTAIVICSVHTLKLYRHTWNELKKNYFCRLVHFLMLIYSIHIVFCLPKIHQYSLWSWLRCWSYLLKLSPRRFFLPHSKIKKCVLLP